VEPLHLRPLTYALLILSLSALGADKPLPGDMHAFLKKYCFDCHGNDVAKAKLSLETLAPDFNDARWVRVHDKLSAGEMPPKKETQPSPDEAKKVVAFLQKELHVASLQRQKTEGRVVIRRLNRTEYENSLHDLLGIGTALKSMLPEDNPVAGFDTVSAGLETSATHLVRYQQAAEKAIDAALPQRPFTSMLVRQTGKQFFDARPKPNKDGLLPFIRFDGDSLVIFASIYKHMSIQTSRAENAGLYRIKASIHAINTDKPMPALFGRISSDRFAHEKLQHIYTVRDAYPDHATVVEFETHLPEGEQVYIEAWNALPSMDQFKKKFKEPPGPDFKEPGLVVDWLEIEGPLDPAAGYHRLFGDLKKIPRRYYADAVAGKPYKEDWEKWHPNEFYRHWMMAFSTNPKPDAERLIRDFLPRAFRRPVDDATAAYFVSFANAQLDKGEFFDDAMRTTYKAILCSPRFLYFIEKPGALDDYAIASRLSHFLWSSLPDDELLALAAKGELHKPESIDAQTERMLRDPKARRFADTFVGQWLDIRKFSDMKPDELYSEYDDALAWAMPQETKLFFDDILQNDRPVTAFLHSDWTFMNDRLAKHYGIKNIAGVEMKRCPLPADSHRGGVMTQAAVLKLTTNATYTSPVKRGAWILDRILGKPPAPPPPDVPAVEPDIRGAVTLRQQLDKHKNVAVCASCHMHIDPPGLALENFDVVGGWREKYRVKQAPEKDGQYVELPNYPGKKVWLAKPVEAASQLEDGRPFNNVDDYKQLLLKDPDQIARNLARKLLVYSTGADIQFADRDVVEDIVKDSREHNYGFRRLIHAVVRSSVFLNK